MVNIQYASDLHINDWPRGTPFESFITPVAPILVIAGDVCSAWDPLYRYFLGWCSRNWHIVIVIAGNHEYYCKTGYERTIQETDYEILQIAAKFQNVIFLQNGASFVLPGTRIRFVGATFWSAIDPAIWDEVYEKKGDFNATFVGTEMGIRRTKPSDINSLHYFHRAYLSSACVPHFPHEILIVITHHMPTKELLEDHYKGEKWSSCYASSAEELMTKNITAWICGHSHRATRWRSPRGPLCLMNARGYNRREELGRAIDKYNPHAIFTL